MPRKTDGPVLRFKRQEKKNWKGSLDADVVEMIEAYPEYYNSTTGDAAPSAEEVIEGAIRKVLGGDGGFKKFLEERRTGARASAAGAGRGASKGREEPTTK